jgi:hypothetical protein
LILHIQHLFKCNIHANPTALAGDRPFQLHSELGAINVPGQVPQVGLLSTKKSKKNTAVF